MNLHLQLSDTAKDQLIALTNQFVHELEDKETLPFAKASTLKELKEQLKTNLLAQKGVSEIWKEAEFSDQQLFIYHPDAAIRNLPWQILSEEQELLSIAKTANITLSPHKPSAYPLKILVMVASPEGVTRLNYEEEELRLLQAFSPLMAQGLAEVHFTDDGSLEDLAEQLIENKYHILHFSGHGIYRKIKGEGTKKEGILALEDPETGRLKETSAKKFNKVLVKAKKKGHLPDLVVLSACQTAQGIASGDISGVANTLIKGGIPAVLAMSASILDNCATLFAATLYQQLSQEFALVDAFQQACLAVKTFEVTTYQPSQMGCSPSQWLIPQLLLNEAIDTLIDRKAKKEALDFSSAAAIISGEQTLVDLRVRPKNYRFIGRRREKRSALQALKKGTSILLRGQGGVGKTALAEHLAIRLLAKNPKTKVFTFSEKKPAAQSLLNQMRDYLTSDTKEDAVFSELTIIQKQSDKFIFLLNKVKAYCNPVFLFDNIESFQFFDETKRIWKWNIDKHQDVLELLYIIDQRTKFPLLITSRYQIAEFADLAICNMNTVALSDFLRKCYQLGLSRLATKTSAIAPFKIAVDEKAPTFEEIVRLLHKTFGGNYRALEFFDELYSQKGEDISQTLGKLADFEQQLEAKEIKEGVLAKMSENLVFQDLISYLDASAKDTLSILSKFNIPVLPMAVGMQRQGKNPKKDLVKGVALTLIEQQKGINGQIRYYIIPIIKELINQIGLKINFDAKIAGDYHQYIIDEKISEDVLGEYTEAFEQYYQAKAIDEINKVGNSLCNFYYNIQQFRLALNYGLRTEKIAGDKTKGTIYNKLGQILQIFGHLDPALVYLEKSLADVTLRGDRQGEGIALNNISQIHKVRGDYNTALKYLEQSLIITQEDIGNRQGEATTLSNIAGIHSAKGEFDKALEILEQVHLIDKDLGDRQGEGTTLNNLATTAHAKEDYDMALKYLEQSLIIRQDIGDRKGEGTTLNNISQIYYVKGDYDMALKYLEQSLIIRQDIGDRKGEGTTLNNISQIHKVRGDHDTALKYLEQSLIIRQDIGDRRGEATTLHNIGATLVDLEKWEAAIPYLVPAYHIQEQIGSPDKEGTASYLGSVIKKIGEARFKEILEQNN